MHRVSVAADALRAAQPAQILGRARRLVPVAALALGPAARVRWTPLARGAGVDDAPQGGPRTDTPHEVGTLRSGGTAAAADDPALWDPARDGLLAAFVLHGFEELAGYAAAGDRTAAGDAFWADLIERWLAAHDRPDPVGWHPYPLSTRIVAWCGALSAGGWPDRLHDAMLASLARQLLVLRRSIERDVGGNHLLRNGCALLIGGACLGDGRARRAGDRLLVREVPRQVLPDGGHEERSTGYQRHVLADLSAAAAVAERADGTPPAWADRLAGMRGWLAALAAPDGSLPLVNDAWAGPAVEPADGEVTVLADSGLVVLRGAGLHVVARVGALGPAHLPAHVHADALSFSVWADGGPVVVDPGTYGYADPRRDALRATAAHATLEVDGQDQCVFWGTFRASLLPRVRSGSVRRLAAGWWRLDAEHDGYRRLTDPVVHRRSFLFHPAAGLVVVDRLEAGRPHDVVSRLPLHPRGVPAGLAVTPLDGETSDAPAGWSPAFGRWEPTSARCQRRTVRPGEPLGWAMLRQGATVEVDAGRVRLRAPGGPDVSVELR